MAILAGAPIAASDVLDLLPVTYTKTAVTSRNSGGTGTTYTDDPELASIALAVGTYEIELLGFFTLTTTNTQKIKTQWKFTGTWNTPIRGCIGLGASQTAVPSAATESTFSGYVADSQDAVYDKDTGGAYGVFVEKARNVTVTVAGNLSLQWAQSASSANNTNLQAGTSFTIRKIS